MTVAAAPETDPMTPVPEEEDPMTLTRSEKFGLLVLLGAVAVCAFALSGCQKEGDQHFSIPGAPTIGLPTLDSCPEGKTACFDIDGRGPMKCLPTRTLGEKLNVCLIGDMCFYGCHD